MKSLVTIILFGVTNLNAAFCYPILIKDVNYKAITDNSKNQTTRMLDGRWKFTVEFPSIGKVDFLINFISNSDTSFTAYSRPKALKDVVGNKKYILSQIFSKKFPKGSFIHIKNGKILENNQLKGIFISPIGNFYFDGKIENEKITGTLSNKTYTHKFIAITHSSDYINYDYSKLILEMENTCKKNIYNPAILNRADWINFFNYFNKSPSLIHDDLEMVFAFYNQSHKLKTSHVYLAKMNVLDVLSIDEDAKNFEHKYIDTNTGYVKFSSFSLNDTVEVKSFIEQLIEKKTPNLIIDLRGCGGGDFSSMKLASYLTDKPLSAGYFLGNNYFNTTNKLPSQEFLQGITPFVGESLDDFINEVNEKGILVGKVFPDTLHYSGKIYVLTDNYTASAAEPLVYFLKNHKIATIIGKKTAGAMLSATSFNFKDNWHIVLPIADYYTNDNKKLDQVGVTPHIKIKSSNALNYVLKVLK